MNKRPVCLRCDFIVVRCLCETLRPINNKTHLVILQHPSETKHALGTVALMQKSFQNMTLLIGEDFNQDPILNSLIETNKDTIALLFPTDKSTLFKSESSTRITHLILIDGTWKKAHKIFIRSKNLHNLVCLKLEVGHFKGQYKIRSTKLGYGLSTLEASTRALSILEKSLDTKSLEDSFKKMIEFQIEKMGIEIFKKNYQEHEENDE